MADAEELLALAPRLALERIEVAGPHERGEWELHNPTRGARLRVSALEYELARRFDGASSLATIHDALLRESQGSVSTQALLSLAGQLSSAGMLDDWPSAQAAAPTAPVDDAGLLARIDESENSLIDEERAQQPSTDPWAQRPTEPARLALAAEQLLRSVSVDPAEVDAMTRQAFSRLRGNDIPSAANIMANAAQLCADKPHLTRWASILLEEAQRSPAPKPDKVMRLLVAAAPDALAALFKLPSSTATALGGASATPGATRPGTAPLGAEGAHVIARALARITDDPTRTSVELPATYLPPEPSVGSPMWLDGEGTLGLTSADEGLVAQLEQMRRKAQEGPWARRRHWLLRMALGTAALVLVALGVQVWRRPSLEGVMVTAQPYRQLLAGQATSLSWPHVASIAAPVAGTIATLPLLQANLAVDRPAATLSMLGKDTSRQQRQLQAQATRLRRERARLQQAMARLTQLDDGWGTSAQSDKSSRQKRRVQEKLSATQEALLVCEHRLDEAKRLGRQGIAQAMPPWPGRVSAIWSKVGQRVKAGVALLQLSDRRLARVAFRAPTIGNWRVGDAVIVTLANAPQVALTGHIVDLQLPVAPPTGVVDKAARARKAGGDITLLIDVIDPSERLARESAANVRVVREDVPLALRVPLMALHTAAGGAPRFWSVDATSRLQQVPAVVLARDDEGAWLRSPGHGTTSVPVIVDPAADAMAPGSLVRLQQ